MTLLDDYLGEEFAVPKVGKTTVKPIGKNTLDEYLGGTFKLPEPPKPSIVESIPQVPQGTARNFGSGLKDALGQVVHYGVGSGSLFKGAYDLFAKPSDQEQQIEKQITGPTNNKVGNVISWPGRQLAKVVVRGLEPLAEGMGNQIASIKINRETANSLANNTQFQTIGKQTQPALTTNLQTGKLTPEDYVTTVMNATNVGLPIVGLLTDFFGYTGNKLTTRGEIIKVTPEMIDQVLKSNKPIPSEGRVVLEHLKENGQSFDLELKRPAGGLRQTVGEVLQGEKIGSTIGESKITGVSEAKPQIAEPFAHETSPKTLALNEANQIQSFAHEPTIVEQGIEPFAHETAGAVGGGFMSQAKMPTGDIGSNGIVPEWGTQNQYYQDNPYRSQLDKMAETGNFDIKIVTKVNLWEMQQVLKDKPAYLSDRILSIVRIQNFVEDNNLVLGFLPDNTPVVAKNQMALEKVLTAQNQRELGLALGYKDIGIPKSSTTLTAELVPGLSKTIEEDIIPKAKGAVQRVKDIYNELAALINPTGQASAEALDIIMKNKGDYEKKIFRAEQTQKSIKKAWDKQPEENRLAFMEKVENGIPVDPQDKALADSYRQRLNNAYGTIARYKEGLNFLENYFPHFWQRPNVVSKDFIPELMARRPLEGQKSFLKKRIFQTIQEGMEAGYKPVSTNPEELMQIYEQSVAKFEMAQKIKLDLKAVGLFKYVQKGKPAPKGYAPIDDKIARVYFPEGELQVTDKYKVKTHIEAGQYMAPTSVARLINNHLSPDWLSQSPTYRTAMQAKNSLNAIQLGFSGFHVLFTTLDSTVTGVDIGISKLARGDIAGAAKEFAKAPFNAYNFFRDGQKFYNGDPELLKIEEDLFHGGASLKHKQYYKSQVFDKFIANVRQGNVIGALGRLPMAAIEGMMRPLFSYYIPRLKVGAFRELFANELERYIKRGSPKTREIIAREVWNNIENRLGELNYDNLFWNRNFKAANMLMWRAVGWNLGTIREIGGATVQDFTKFTWEAAHGRKPDLTSKMRYTLALIFVMATIGSIYEYLHTGHGPKNVKDMFYPENGATDVNGDPVRVQFPSYLKDMYGYSQEPITTIGNKMSPEISILIDVLQNQDYYGNYVYDPNAGLPQKTAESLKFIFSQIKPFSISNIVQLRKGKATVAEQAESFLGIQKSPQDVSQSERTKVIFENLQEQGPKTPEEQKLSQLKNQYRKQIQEGNIPSLEELVNAGIVTNATGYRAFIKAAKLTPADRAYKTLPKAKKSTIPNK
jgi:hypothetical protein